MPQPVKNADFYPLLLFHVGMNDITSQNLGRIKEDYKALEMQLKNGAQITFSFILPVRGKDAARKRCIMEINIWLRECCHEYFDFDDKGAFFDDYSLLGRNGINPPRRDKGIFSSRQSCFVRWALKQRTRGPASKVTMSTPLHPTGNEPGWSEKQQNSSAASPHENQNAKHLKYVYSCGGSSCTLPSKLSCFITSLKYLYTNSCSTGDEQQELEICVQ